MSDSQNTIANSFQDSQKEDYQYRQGGQKLGNKNIDLASKSKKKTRKSMAPKLQTEIKQLKNEINESSTKQFKLTQLWKVPTSLSQSNPKYMSNQETIRKKIEDQLVEKNNLIVKIKNEKEVAQKKLNILQNQSRLFRNRAIDVIKKTILQLAESNRIERSTINSYFGYFKDASCKLFVQGPFLVQIRKKIKDKIRQIQEVKVAIKQSEARDKQMLSFSQRFFQKEIDELREQQKQRQKIVASYRQRLAFAQIESECMYSKLSWPAIGQKQRFQTLQLLGSGGFGSVYKCFDLLHLNYVAVKQNKFSAVAGSKSEEHKNNYLKHMERQVKIQKTLNHPNIAKLLQIIKMDQTQVSFVMQFLEGPDLGKYLKQKQCLPQVQAKQIIRQILSGLKYLSQQDNKIIHYDLKPSNIMFHRGIVKIVDFGLCKQMDSDQTKIGLTSFGVGTYYYLPPQTFMEDKAQVSPKVDVWSVGVIFYELLYGMKPFGHGKNQLKIYSQGIILNARKVQFKSQTPHRYKVSDAAKNFIKDCLAYDQKDRLSAAQAYQHQYFK